MPDRTPVNVKVHVGPWTSLKETFPVRKAEWVLSFMVLGLWFVLAVNPALLAGDTYGGMREIMPQWGWRWLCFVIGATGLSVLIVNGAYWRTPHLRALCAFFRCGLWLQFALGVSGNVGLGLVLMPGLFILDMFNFRQAFLEAAASEGLRNAGRRFFTDK